MEAVRLIAARGIPEVRHSTKYSLLLDGERYPPKYVVSVANAMANGEELDPSEFSGGDGAARY
jgi:5-methylcytosine-specific restriction protein B